jgi:hypothetical protein
MKRFYLLVFILLIGAGAMAQPYENSWINYSQQYFKIKVWQEGIFRISTNDLLLAGIPAPAIDNRNIQIFHNGQEQYIYIYDQNSNLHIDGNDYKRMTVLLIPKCTVTLPGSRMRITASTRILPFTS